ELNDMTVAQGERTENDLTRILSHGTGSNVQPSTGHTGALTAGARRRGIAILLALGAAAGLIGAVLLSSDGSDARSEPEVTQADVPEAEVPVEPPPPPQQPQADEQPAIGEPVASESTLDVVTRPEGAQVTLGELAPLTSPAHFDKVPPGRYDVRVELKGHIALARSVELAAGEHRSLELDLDPVQKPAP